MRWVSQERVCKVRVTAPCYCLGTTVYDNFPCLVALLLVEIPCDGNAGNSDAGPNSGFSVFSRLRIDSDLRLEDNRISIHRRR